MTSDAEHNGIPRRSTIITLMLVIALATGIVLFYASNVGGPYPPAEGRARNVLSALVMAMGKYRDDFAAYPPDNTPTSDGGEVLYHFLCQRFRWGELQYGPYLENAGQLAAKGRNGLPAVRSPFGGNYEYRLLVLPPGKAPGFLLIDPGFDRLLGGTIDLQKGFVPDKTILNKDGRPACEDNISSDKP
ncbi:MAG: hypothetical protein NTW87_19245 [Planctomycetota bacterium]|nr:hypothetical protein [Planctomycetota bacterium]